MAETLARYGIVGRGWRARFFLRLAAAMPDRFAVTGVVTRTAAAGAEVEAEFGVATCRLPGELLRRERPDFVITSVPWDVNPGLVEALVDAGVPVLSETPPAPDLDRMRALWSRVGASGLVQVAEQYLLMPDHAARLAVVRSGAIGVPTSAQVSSTHGYHAVSIMRGMLDAGLGDATVDARAFVAPLADPLTPDGWRGDDSPRDATTTIATIDFGGRMGLYDFTDNQWWNPLRTDRLVVRGSRGELVDDHVTRLVDPATPVRSSLVRRQTGQGFNLEGFDLDHVSFDGAVVYRNPFAGARLSDEEVAIATLLSRMAAWTRDAGPAPYPLSDACQDHLIALAVAESVRSGGAVTTPREAWATP
jgi:predicted dehydrogenase